MARRDKVSGSEKKGLLEKESFQKSPFSIEILEMLENPQTLENKGESDYLPEILEIPENFEILEILE